MERINRSLEHKERGILKIQLSLIIIQDFGKP